MRRRAARHVGVLLTATLTALVTAVLLVSATVLAPGVAQSALERTLAGADTDESELTASTGMDEEWLGLDERVRAVATESGVVASVVASAASAAYSAPGMPDDHRLAVSYVEGADTRAELTDGRWPADGAPVVEAAVHRAALDTLRIAVGDILELHPLTGDDTPVPVTVVGAYVPADAADPVWRGYGAGVRPAPSGGFTVVGPVLAERDDFAGRLAPDTASAAWQLALDRDAVTLDTAVDAAAAVRELRGRLSDLRATEAGQQVSVDGAVAELVERARDAAAATRALLLVVVVMLAVLSGWALLFTARLVAGRRAPASALLRARGARTGPMLRWSATGVLVPAALVALAAPPLARLVLRPLREEVEGTPTAAAGWIVAAAVAAGWLVLMVAVDLRSGRSVSGVAAETARPRRAAAQRAGLDLALLVLGMIALQQLRRPPGEAGEVVVTVAPALVVVAGTVVLIRALPWVARAVASLTTARPGIAAMLGAQETARRTARHVAAGVLVVLAITVSVFSATTQSTWAAFRGDAVDLAEPADVRVVVDTAVPAAGSQDETRDELLGLPGVEAAMPVVRGGYRDGELTVDVVGVDLEAAPSVVRWGETDRLSALHGEARGALPVLVTSGFAEALGLSSGDEATLDLGGGQPVPVLVAGLVDTVPGSTRAAAVLADAEALSTRLGLPAGAEWWLSTVDDGAAAATAARELTAVDDVTTHAQALADAEDDPSSAGIMTGLTAGLAFTAVFVVIGVVVHSVTSFQSRSAEYALLRAIGLGRRSVAGSVTVEHTVLLGFATLAGLGLGLVVAWLVVPHAVAGLTGLPEVPPLRLSVPWPVVALLGCAIVVLAAVLVAVQIALTRHIDAAAVLREGT
ncbi:ABC transporter permease [Jiangella asiatica]|uniref:ABC transporter permease n=1 Tax=Jiangella asiatica TaxID=2530372 RepID=A0A4V2YZS9_9ACTN|nr:ABC transporter permease [Jiangella asiatica]